jgi:hypothetical protein
MNVALAPTSILPVAIVPSVDDDAELIGLGRKFDRQLRAWLVISKQWEAEQIEWHTEAVRRTGVTNPTEDDLHPDSAYGKARHRHAQRLVEGICRVAGLPPMGQQLGTVRRSKIALPHRRAGRSAGHLWLRLCRR